MSGTGAKVELCEYPEDIDELDDKVLEHLCTDGKPYKLLVGGSVITTQVLLDHVVRAAVLEVLVEVDAPKKADAKVVLKLVNTRPLQKHQLAHFPEDLDELDDAVLNHLITDGSPFEMRTDGDLLTMEKYAEFKSVGTKLVVHVSKSPPPQATFTTNFVWNSSPPQAPAESFQAPCGSATKPAGSPAAQMKTEAIESLRMRFAEAKQSAYFNGSNVLVANMEAESELFKQIKSDSEAVRDTELGMEATSLLKEMARVFGAGLTETLSTRKTIANIQKVTSELADAFLNGNSKDVKVYMQQCQDFANKLKTRADYVTASLAELQGHLQEAYDRYAKAEKSCRRVQKANTVLSALSGSGGAACGVGAATTGLATGGSAAGWFMAAVPAMWNPVGVALFAGCGICAIVAGGAGYYACKNAAAKEQMGQMNKMVSKAEKVGVINEDLWDGVSKHLGVTYSAFEDVANFSPKQLRLFGEAFLHAAESLSTLEKAVDEYLVYLSLKQLYPINFNVRTVVGHQRFEQIKDELSVVIYPK